jgi:hypothetical protein
MAPVVQADLKCGHGIEFAANPRGYRIGIGALNRNVPHAITSAPCSPAAGANFASGSRSLSQASPLRQ